MKNILVAYQGGGYDGCFWEWNWFSFDRDGKFHNIFSSGSMGIKTEEQAAAMVNEKEEGVYIYDLTSDANIDTFQNEHAAPHVVGLVEKINAGEYGEYDQKIWFTCDKCDEKVFGEGHLEDWHGCGGIASTADTKLCEDCHSSHTCMDCGEYSEEVEDNGGRCNSCMAEAMDAALKVKEDYFFLDYDKQENRFIATDLSEIDKDELTDSMWDVEIYVSDGIFNYVVDADSEYNAIEYVSIFLDGVYYKASAEKFSVQELING